MDDCRKRTRSKTMAEQSQNRPLRQQRALAIHHFKVTPCGIILSTPGQSQPLASPTTTNHPLSQYSDISEDSTVSSGSLSTCQRESSSSFNNCDVWAFALQRSATVATPFTPPYIAFRSRVLQLISRTPIQHNVERCYQLNNHPVQLRWSRHHCW